MQASSSPRKNPYLSQYKNDMNAKQKLIRSRLSTTALDENNQLQPTGSRSQLNDDKIPSIDDEAVEKISQERRYKSRFSYYDDEAEASLQFFKKNLQPGADLAKPASLLATGSLFDRPSHLSNSRPALELNPKAETLTRTRRSLYETDLLGDSTTRASPDKYQIGSGKPVPFKQTALDEPKLERSSARVRTTAVPVKTGEPSMPRGMSSKLLENFQDSPPVERVHSSDHRSLASSRPKPSERGHGNSAIKSTKLDEDLINSRLNVASLNDPEPARSNTDSPSQNGTFTRKPLYNSLLRAHDSIRLKVNRPKVRPKSDVPVEDTVVDDSIPLAEINSQTSIDSERAVDVKRGSSTRGKRGKKKNKEDAKSSRDSKEKLPVRNFSEVRIVKIVRDGTERSMGVTVRAEDGNIVVARIMAGSLADKQGALQAGDVILSVNNREVYTPEQLQTELRKSISEDTVVMKIVPSFREELPTLCLYVRALFSYDANEDTLLPCKEVGVSFNQGDILEVVNQEDPNWWQARRVDSENLQTGLIPSQDLEERRRAFVSPDYDLATKTSVFGTKVLRKSRRKEIYNVGQNCDFDKAELQLYEEVCRTPAFERRTLVLIGANGVGKQALKARLIALDPERFGTPLPHTSRLPRDGEEDGIHYHFVTREKMEEDIIDGKYLEYGEYDGALYGTKLDSVREIIGSGKVCVLDCSPTCLKVLKTSDYLPFVAFIAAPTLDQLRYMHEWARSGNRNYTTLDRALSRQSRRAKTLQDFAFDFFEDEDLQLTVEESARLFRMYENYFDIVLVNNNFETTFQQLKDAIDALSMAPQWIPISWIYGT